MNKKVWKEVEERSEGLCEFPGCHGNFKVEKHHVYGRANRSRMEMTETVFNLCNKHHHNSSDGVHFNESNKHLIERMAEENLMSIGWTKEDIIRETQLDSRGVGQNYINWCKKH